MTVVLLISVPFLACLLSDLSLSSCRVRGRLRLTVFLLISGASLVSFSKPPSLLLLADQIYTLSLWLTLDLTAYLPIYIMAASATCSTSLCLNGALCPKSMQNVSPKRVSTSSRFSRTHIVRAAQLQTAPPTRDAESSATKGDLEDAALKVFADDTKGIVCYRTESGEIVCEGMDEGPHFYPPCGSNFYMPDTRAAAILPLLGEGMYEI